MEKEKTVKKKGSVMTTREKMLARKKDLEKRSGGGGIIYPKEGTIRVRIKSRGADEELGIEIIQFYLGPKEGGIYLRQLSMSHVLSWRSSRSLKTPTTQMIRH